ncbi:BACON domain-containing protein [Paraflavitalea sp. CAU 1676]|uniref:BACON domain-containing protein n=1 Tax=Paraflavitalea sp. CAU 1676 TaxID=3032598 RepID=UPI0023DCEAEA|nr:BACON domain-containing protein [Paraflavitalea sp. CAU 1676]MDF2191304.1 BACON domain-containing protein [Paraflavitalea sp. CAU 1676]
MEQMTSNRLKIGLIFTYFGMLFACNKKPGEPPAVSIDKAVFEIQTSGGDSPLTITSNTTWKLSGLPDWVKASAAEGTGQTTIKLMVDTNAAQTARTASLVLNATGIPDVTVTINQKGLVDWSKEFSNFEFRDFAEVTDGYVLAGEIDGKVSFIKVTKDGKSILLQKTIEPNAYTTGNIVSMDTIAGGGYVIAVNASKIGTYGENNLSAYLAKLSPNFEIIKEKMIDYGTNNRELPHLIRSTNDGFVLAFSSSDNSSHSMNITKLNQDLTVVVPNRGLINQVSDLTVAPDGSILAVGSFSNATAYKYDRDLNVTDYHYGQDAGFASIVVSNNGYMVTGVKNNGANFDIHCMMLDTELKPMAGKDVMIDRAVGVVARVTIPLGNGGFAISGSTGENQDRGFTTRLDKNLLQVPKKELSFDAMFLERIIDAVATSDGGYVVAGYGEDNKVRIVRINP